MDRMIRINVSVPRQQLSWLQAQAEALGVTMGEVLRRIIDCRRLEDPMTLKKL
jgi:hypothetical protein